MGQGATMNGSPSSRFVVPSLLLLATTAGGQTPASSSGAGSEHAAPTVAASRVHESVQLDGRLNETAWGSAVPVTTFIQVDPDEGAPVSERTEARILYTADALYVGVRLHDRGRVSSRLGRRDMARGSSDWFGIVLDSYHDHRTAFGFEVNPHGVRRDEQRSEDASDASWDPVWEAATSVDTTGWTAEIRIPFTQLRFSPLAEQTWGIQLERRIDRTNEYAVFSFTPKKERGGIARFGHLHGLRDLRPGRRLEILPYAVARAEYVEPGANPYRGEAEYGSSVGMDLKYRLSSDLTLDATLNPDFGQVEVDPAVVNLTAFETFYEERRPFFIEGAGIFDFGFGSPHGILFYSRRIGRRPQLAPPSPQADVPPATTILGAGKLSGKTRHGWSVGVLEVLTQREEARYLDLEGEEREFTVEPLTHYFVGRVNREMRSGSAAVGAIVTAVNRDLDAGYLRGGLRSDAYAGGVDFRREWANRAWRVSGFVAGSHIRGAPGAMLRAQRSSARYFQRPDADHLEPDTLSRSLSGYAAYLQIRRQAGKHWQGDLSLSAASPGYEINDLGFQFRADYAGGTARLTYLENRPGRVLRSYRLSLNGAYDGNYDGDRIGTSFYVSSYWQHRSYWSLIFTTGYFLPALDDRLTRGGPLARSPAMPWAYGVLSTDARKPVTLSASAYGHRNTAGETETLSTLQLSYKPSPRWSLSFGPDLTRRHSLSQFVRSVADVHATGTYGRRYVFADVDQTTLSLSTRVNWTFTPDLTLELFAQPYFTAADFSAYREFLAPGRFDFATYGRDRGTVEPQPEGTFRVDPDGTGPSPAFVVGDLFGTRDFSVRSLRGNAVLRWEWRRGSTL
ncbi:MAG TPA: DUF5916 domain-containing protein, partial [Longimicrobiaceae bacterium]|nr:DUF5916 domain-containing protein [Longimicrobiaceae bacterium]